MATTLTLTENSAYVMSDEGGSFELVVCLCPNLEFAQHVVSVMSADDPETFFWALNAYEAHENGIRM